MNRIAIGLGAALAINWWIRPRNVIMTEGDQVYAGKIYGRAKIIYDMLSLLPGNTTIMVTNRVPSETHENLHYCPGHTDYQLIKIYDFSKKVSYYTENGVIERG